MRLRLSVARPDAAGPPVDVVLAADEGTTLGEVRAAVLGVACAPPGSALLVEGRPLDDAAPVGVPPLVDGVLLVAGPAGPTASADRGGLLELHVVGGPDAGAVHRLAPGRHRLGRSPDCDVRVDDVDVSRVHAVLDVATSGVTVTDLGSTNGTTVDGEPVPTEPRPLPLGAVLRAGSTTLVLRLPPRDAASVRPTRTGALEVNRPPRLPLPPLATTVRFPRRPEPPERRGVPLLAALLPLAVSVPMAVLWSPFALLLGLTSPVMVLGSYLGDRRSGRRRHAEATAGYEAELAEAERRVAELLLAERRQRRRSSPDAATLVVAADVPTSRLWERRPGDADFLLLGVGTGPVASAVTVVRPADGDERENPLLDDAPVGVSLRAAGVVGLCGPRRAVLGLARWLVVQVACLHAPADAGVVVLAAGTAGHDWTWTRWLPHARPDPDAAPWTASGTADVERL
ncbi:MAG: FHA domain-containing protein, partial [Actinomycetes bacterium]